MTPLDREAPTSLDPTDHRWIDTEPALAALVDELRDEPELAIDTEFHRERTFFAEVSVVQIGWSGGIALIDTLTVDPAPLAPLLGGGRTITMHAAAQDLEVMQRACGTVPDVLFDTQIAAGFIGYGTPSLSSLLQGELGVALPKGDRLTDWLRRPLGLDARTYAAGDVAHLLPLADKLRNRLVERGRLEWAEDECANLRARSMVVREPTEAWWRVKEARSLRGTAVGVAQCVAAWRERRAAEIDQPIRFVLPDLALVGIAQKPPANEEQLRRVRGLDDRHLRRDAAAQLLAAIAEGQTLPKEQFHLPPAGEVDRELRPAVTLVSAWVSQLARDQAIDTTILATRGDLEALIRGDADARLAAGWRAEAVGDAIRALVAGEAALAFGGPNRLVLEQRSRVTFQ
ncbi:MAG: HRDC domain-containing protein [Acidimicrobiia bacterium]|nr:HRDC domain-containing protein [Acidimicrobiia bacterium]